MASNQEIRLRLLNRVIEQHPDAAVNYVLRGEYWLEQGDFQQAEADFLAAIVLGQAELETSDWGFLQQALVDRARQGLREIGTLG
jgi:tetratricopeptide (TPR) repeat protein